MSNNVKEINTENHTHNFLDYIINIKDFDPNNIKIDEKSYKNIFIYYVGYVKNKKYIEIYSVNPLCLIFTYVIQYFEEINESKYLMPVPTNENKHQGFNQVSN